MIDSWSIPEYWKWLSTKPPDFLDRLHGNTQRKARSLWGQPKLVKEPTGDRIWLMWYATSNVIVAFHSHAGTKIGVRDKDAPGVVDELIKVSTQLAGDPQGK
jgi:hypothetical protein